MNAMTISCEDFVAAADAALGDLLDSATRTVDLQRCAVSWLRPAAEIRAEYDITRSHEVLVGLKQPGVHGVPFEVADVLRATHCPSDRVAQVELIQTSDPAVLTRLLMLIRELLRTYAGPFLAGDDSAFERADHVQAERARRHTAEVVAAPSIARAEEAWARHDLEAFREILAPVAHLLDQRLTRRLDYAIRHTSEPAPGG